MCEEEGTAAGATVQTVVVFGGGRGGVRDSSSRTIVADAADDQGVAARVVCHVMGMGEWVGANETGHDVHPPTCSRDGLEEKKEGEEERKKKVGQRGTC